MNDPNLIFYIFAMMLAPAIILTVVITLIAQSNRKINANGFGVTRHSDEGIHGDVVIVPERRAAP